jgi:hypothetical protein
MRQTSPRQRDAGLQKVSRLTRWIAAASAAAAGAFALVVAQHRPSAAAGVRPPSGPAPTDTVPPSAQPGDDGAQPAPELSPPAQAPQPATGFSQATSGAS